jgi:hypothetical protein
VSAEANAAASVAAVISVLLIMGRSFFQTRAGNSCGESDVLACAAGRPGAPFLHPLLRGGERGRYASQRIFSMTKT